MFKDVSIVKRMHVCRYLFIIPRTADVRRRISRGKRLRACFKIQAGFLVLVVVLVLVLENGPKFEDDDEDDYDSSTAFLRHALNLRLLASAATAYFTLIFTARILIWIV